MFSRTVSLVLIAAVIACPLWCDDAIGFAGQCCPEGESDTVMVCGGELVDCRCEENGDPHRRAPHQNDDDHQCPCESAGCQGICGGAVFEKSVQLDQLTDALLLPLVDAHAPVNLHLLECSSHHRSEHFCCGSSANHGRTVRTLHMSFLC